MTSIINTLGFGIASLMAIGAVFGAILTMYTAVASRSREIATLRAIGFNTLSVIVSVLAESVVLGGIGGIVGGAIVAYAAFNGFPDLDHELSDLQPGCLRISRDARADHYWSGLRALHRAHRRTSSRYSCRAAADFVGIAGAVTTYGAD